MTGLRRFIRSLKRILNGERRPDHICPECGAPVAFQEAWVGDTQIYDVWNCPNGHQGERGTEATSDE